MHEVINALSPAALRRRARELDAQAVDLAQRAASLRMHAAHIQHKRAQAKRLADYRKKGGKKHGGRN